MDNFLSRIFSKEPNSARQAKERLQLVLINDRTDLSPKAMASLKDDLLEVLSQYIEIDAQAMTIDITQEGRQQRLIADIPISGPNRQTY